MKFVVFVFLSLVFSGGMLQGADDATRRVQSQLQALGFYYGAVDGEPGPETEAAVRRYQIRNGLPVTGAVDEDTAFSLRKGGLPSIEPKPEKKPQTANRDVTQSDREFLARPDPTPVPPQPSRGAIVPPPASYGSSDVEIDWRAAYDSLFVGTPLERSSRRTQRSMVAQAQAQLRRYQFYGNEIDGLPGEMTTQAILDFQRHEALRMTGRLDELTLRELGLWPPGGRSQPGGYDAEPGRRVYRGQWIQ